MTDPKSYTLSLETIQFYFQRIKNIISQYFDIRTKKRNSGQYIKWVEAEIKAQDTYLRKLTQEIKKHKSTLRLLKNELKLQKIYFQKLETEALPIKLFLENHEDFQHSIIQLSLSNDQWDAICYTQFRIYYIEVTTTKGFQNENGNGNGIKEAEEEKSPTILSNKEKIELELEKIIDRINKKINKQQNYSNNHILLVYSQESTISYIPSELDHIEKEVKEQISENIFHSIYLIFAHGEIKKIK